MAVCSFPQFRDRPLQLRDPTPARPHFVAQAIAYSAARTIQTENWSSTRKAATCPKLRAGRTSGWSAAPRAGGMGAKRQVATEAARDEIVARWMTTGMRRNGSAGPILQGAAEITALNDVMFMLISARPF